jgi:hypothetical protein
MTATTSISAADVPLIPISNAGAAGLNYSIFWPNGSANGLANVTFKGHYRGHGCGPAAVVTQKLTVTAHVFARNNSAAPGSANLVYTWNQDARDLLETLQPTSVLSGYTWLGSQSKVLTAASIQLIQPSEGAAQYADCYFAEKWELYIPCFSDIPRDDRKSVGIVLVAEAWLNETSQSPLLARFSLNCTQLLP